MQLTFSHSVPQAGNAMTYHFEKPADFSYEPGQYLVWKLDAGGEQDDENKRYFTLSSSPSEDTLALTTRVSDSLFKKALQALESGDTIEVVGPKGKFIWEGDDTVVLVAGGIGVTPYRSMIVERARNGQSLKATLLYFNRNDEIVFRDEFEQIVSEHPELSIQYVVGEDISAASILERVPQAKDCMTYLSGAEAMVEQVGEALKQQAIDVRQDWFSGYDDTSY